MKLSIILSVLLTKLFLNNAVVIKATNQNNIALQPSDIGCYDCITRITIGKTFAYDNAPTALKNKDVCINNNNTFRVEAKSEYLCAITMLYPKVFEYDSITATENTVIDLKFSAVSNENCLVADKQENSDIICLDSSCKKTILCCNEKNYCNTVERFKLLQVVAYSDTQDQKLKNSYSQYTNSKCQLSAKSLKQKRYQECIIATAGINKDTRPPCDLATTTFNIEKSNLTIIVALIYSFYKNLQSF